MAMLTFLRIGKEIYDETEEYIINHLLYRQQRFYHRALTKCRKTFALFISKIFKMLGIDGLI